MEDLILKAGNKKITICDFDSDKELLIEVFDTKSSIKPIFSYLTPRQVRELIEHLTNCLKDVENEVKEEKPTCKHDYFTFFNKGYRKCNKCGHEYTIS